MFINEQSIDQEYIDDLKDQVEDLTSKLDSYTLDHLRVSPETIGRDTYKFVQILEAFKREGMLNYCDPDYWLINGSDYHYSNNEHFRRYVDRLAMD